MMEFRTFFCDPLQANIIELSDIAQDTIIDHFEKIDWNDYLQKSRNAKLDNIYYDPTFGVENNENKNGLSISAVGDPDNYDFRITYKQPQEVKSIWGLNDKITENYSSIKGQTKEEAINCLKALLRNDTLYLANKVANEE